ARARPRPREGQRPRRSDRARPPDRLLGRARPDDARLGAARALAAARPRRSVPRRRQRGRPDGRGRRLMALPASVAVVGAGTMGSGIAQVFATQGVPTILCDVDAAAVERGTQAIAKSLDRFVQKERITASERDAVLARIRTATDVAEAVRDVDLMVEAVYENLDVKRDLFTRAAEAAPERAILASNTSSISITVLAAATGRSDRVIGMHFMNPVPLMRLVEVIRGQDTSQATTDAVLEWTRALDKVPVEAQDYPGFVSNRVLMPMINEAAYCLME